MDRRAEQYSQPLGCKVMGEDKTGAVPGIWGHTGHPDHPCNPPVPSLCKGADLDPSRYQVVVWGRGLGHHASSP